MSKSSFDHITNEQKGNIAYYLGLSEHDKVRKDTVSADEDIAIDSMVNLKCNTYLPKHNLIVRSFLKGVANISNDAVTESHLDKPDAYKLSKTPESIMNLSVTNSVLPLHFRESLIEFHSLTANFLLK